ncbi:MAG: DUF4154 domain-containing protein [Bacteroidia bacterium]|nr:DUF4154 domain-containing protein [Bacteroidia bacterium]
MSIKYRIFLFAAVILVNCPTLVAQGSTTHNSTSEKHSKIKTAFIYNFTKYIFWPAENTLKEFVICVMNSETLTEQLSNTTKYVKFRDRVPVKVIYCKNISELKPCQVVLFSGTGASNPDEIYNAIKGKNTLMIAENLHDYQKSMIAFVEFNGKINYTINKTKVNQAGLEVKKVLYDLAVNNDAEWNSIMSMVNQQLAGKNKKLKLEQEELRQLLNLYNSVENKKHNNELTNHSLEDSLLRKIEQLNSKEEEFKKINAEIERSRLSLYDQERKISKQKRMLYSQGSKITQQKMVIVVICVLSAFVLLLLFFAIRNNNQRKKAMQLLSRRKSEIERQKQLVDEKQKEILDSINYAKRIQKALMANEKVMNDNLNEHFIFFKPKDIVAGDFYWAARLPDSFLYVTGDSTGHGVPGAFMSLLNITKLNEAVNQKLITRPDLILNDVRENIIAALNPEGSLEESKDGMDAILCRIDFANMKLQYSAANSNFCIIRKREILNLKADKMPIGKSNDDTIPFTFNEIALHKGDMIYTFSDGYGDQFGGPKGKKFKHKMLKEILVKISELSPETQHAMLERQLEDWMGHLEQVDDILVIGVRV